jgi:hypothetical protein
MCFGHLAKLAVKSCMSSCESIGESSAEKFKPGRVQEKNRSETLHRQRKSILLAVLDWRASR